PCLLSVGTVLLTAWLGAMLMSLPAGLAAGAILAFSKGFVVDAVNGHLDNVMGFFILASFALWLRGRRRAASVCAGGGMWFKTPVALLLFPALAAQELARGGPRALLSRPALPRLAGGAALALCAGMLVWVATGLIGGWELARDYWVRQLWGTAVGGRG